MKQKFNLNIDGKKFEFELDEYGLVWYLESNEILGQSKFGYGHEPIKNIEEAKKIAKKILVAQGLIEA